MATDDKQPDEKPEVSPQPARAAQHEPPAKVPFIGVPSADSATSDSSTPQKYRSHPLLQGCFFYTIPDQLLHAVCEPRINESFEVEDSELLRMELDLSAVSGDHASRVGFWNNLPIECLLMHSLPIPVDIPAGLGGAGAEAMLEGLRAAEDRLRAFSVITSGYAGWLMTNPEYLDELESLITSFGEQMQRWGTQRVGIPIPTDMPPGPFNSTQEEGWQEYEEAILGFCTRWRLQGLAGPRIPLPMRPMMAGQFPLSVVKQLMRAGGLFNWPDTFPLLSRDEMRELIGAALQFSQMPEHLQGWGKIISPDNKAKNKIGSYSRQLRLQHFWRLLRERHPAAFHRRISRVDIAFAEYFGVSVATIQRERSQIEDSLGPDWDE